MKTLPGGIFRHRKGKCRGADSWARLRTSARNRLTIKTYKPIASVAAVSDRLVSTNSRYTASLKW